MMLPALIRRSLAYRLALLVLAVVVALIVALTWHLRSALRDELEQALGEQQVSVAALLAHEIDARIAERFVALENVAAQITPAMLRQPAQVQALLDAKAVLPTLFSNGLTVSGADGVALASVPFVAQRTGTSYMDRDFMLATLREGRKAIGKPVIGRRTGVPAVSLSVPIRDEAGKTVGALVGGINLAASNFLDQLLSGRYGLTGGNLLVDRANRVIITASDKTRVLEQLRPPREIPQIDHFVAGANGSAVLVNPHGVQILVGVAQLQQAPWYVVIQLPTSEAFAPAQRLEQQMLLAALVLTLLAGVLIVVLLRRQLAPLHSSVATLRQVAAARERPAALPVRGEDEVAELIASVNQLLSDIGANEQALAAESARLHDIIDGAPVPMALCDAAGTLLFLNRSFTATLGYACEDIPTLSEWWPSAYPDPDYRRWVMETWAARLDDHRRRHAPFVPMEVTIRCKDGSERSVLGSGTALPHSRAGEHLIVLYDITERKQGEIELERHRGQLEALVAARTAELVEARDAAEAASRAKSTFLANMSHELRTPLTAVIGMTDLALRRATDTRQSEQLGKAMRAARHLLEVINSILDISKIEAGRVTLEKRDFDLRALLDDTLRMQDEAARQKQLRLAARVDADVPPQLHGDPLRLQQVLINFVGNAVKFSERGEIFVRAFMLGDDGRRVRLRIEVHDEGIGLSESEQRGLFTAFTQVDSSTTRQHGGTGLGLAISKRLALLMGGDVGVVSEPGRGSTFWLELPLGHAGAGAALTPAPAPADAELRRRFAGSPVLVVEDEAINREIIKNWLEDAELVPDFANNGQQALSLAREGHYAAILMDVQMPVMDGYEATRQLRQVPRLARTPIIALTANVFETDRQHALEAGMNDHLGKPISEPELHACLLRWLSAPAEAVMAAGAEPGTAAQSGALS